jgi:hypothetical protein
MSVIRRNAAGYTLTEILLALLIFGLAVAGLLSLFPAVHVADKESRDETLSALVASGILDALQDPESPRRLHVATGTHGGTPCWESLDPAVNSNAFLLYDSSCRPLRTVYAKEADLPQKDPGVAAVVTLDLFRGNSLPGLLSAEVAVASPASAPAANRAIRRYSKLIPIP